MKILLILTITLVSLSGYATDEVCTHLLLDREGRVAVSSTSKMSLKKCLEWGGNQVKTNLNGSSYSGLILQHPGLHGQQLKLTTEAEQDFTL